MSNNNKTTTPVVAECHAGRPFYSPTARVVNRFLYGNSIGNDAPTGVLVRIPDQMDDPIALATTYAQYQYRPATLLHASLRAANSIYDRESPAGIVIARKFRRNVVMVETKNHHHHQSTTTSTTMIDVDNDDYVDCAHYYPTDAASLTRNALLVNGEKACWSGADTNLLCLPASEHHNGSVGGGGEICHSYQGSHCECNSTAVPPEHMGQHFALYARTYQNRYKGFTRFSCSYHPTTTATSSYTNNNNNTDPVTSMIAASNSLYLHRFDWWRGRQRNPPLRYVGWNECIATRNIGHSNMVDAWFVKLPVLFDYQNVSLCDASVTPFWDSFQTALQDLYEHYGNASSSSRPVLFFKETLGMSTSRDECQVYWGGHDCHNGYRKEFFAQELNFSNGACLAIPRKHHNGYNNCDDDEGDVYYFPVDNTTGLCSAFVGSAGATAVECSREMQFGTQQQQATWNAQKMLLGKLEAAAMDGFYHVHFSNILAFQSTVVFILLIFILCMLPNRWCRNRRTNRNSRQQLSSLSQRGPKYTRTNR